MLSQSHLEKNRGSILIPDVVVVGSGVVFLFICFFVILLVFVVLVNVVVAVFVIFCIIRSSIKC